MSVVKEWLDVCTLKQQTVLLSALRGCDGKMKEDYSKPLTRKFRSVILKNAGGVQKQGNFMHDSVGDVDEIKFISNLDHYPMHWLLHFLHAIEIVGYKHPDKESRCYWHKLYLMIVDALHLSPESEETLDARLADVINKDKSKDSTLPYDMMCS